MKLPIVAAAKLPIAAAVLAGFVLLAGPSHAQRSNPGGGSKDPCMQEADRLYSGMRDLEARMRTKREHVAKCRAGRR